MRTLVIECATEACSVALFDGPELLDHSHEVLGRGHAERLIPTIAGLPEKGRANRILVALGPGSFTGVRIGLAAARALGLAWSAEVRGYPTLTLVAATKARTQPGPVTICMHGGHGEWFVQNFAADLAPEDAVCSLVPAEAAMACRHPTIAGSRSEQMAELLNDDREALALHPDARAAMLLPEASLIADLSPIYGRAPDAKPAATPA